jgi:undecaprenyl-diphosphatase
MSPEQSGPFEGAPPFRGILGAACDDLFTSLDLAELVIVGRVTRFTDRNGLARIARIATRLGDGWLYPALAFLLILSGCIESTSRFLAAAAVSVLIVFSGYPALKRFLSRRRPCDYDPSLLREISPLDRYSCPSGHTMMAAAFSVVLLVAWPAGAAISAAITGIIGWSRIALGHHYATDVVIGGALGGMVAAIIANLFF